MSDTVTVFLKALNGDLIAVPIRPELYNGGAWGLAHHLERSDPVAFPLSSTAAERENDDIPYYEGEIIPYITHPCSHTEQLIQSVIDWDMDKDFVLRNGVMYLNDTRLRRKTGDTYVYTDWELYEERAAHLCSTIPFGSFALVGTDYYCPYDNDDEGREYLIVRLLRWMGKWDRYVIVNVQWLDDEDNHLFVHHLRETLGVPSV